MKQIIYQINHHKNHNFTIIYDFYSHIFEIIEQYTYNNSDYNKIKQYSFTLKILRELLSNYSFNKSINIILSRFYNVNDISKFDNKFYNELKNKLYNFYITV